MKVLYLNTLIFTKTQFHILWMLRLKAQFLRLHLLYLRLRAYIHRNYWWLAWCCLAPTWLFFYLRLCSNHRCRRCLCGRWRWHILRHWRWNRWSILNYFNFRCFLFLIWIRIRLLSVQQVIQFKQPSSDLSHSQFSLPLFFSKRFFILWTGALTFTFIDLNLFFNLFILFFSLFLVIFTSASLPFFTSSLFTTISIFSVFVFLLVPLPFITTFPISVVFFITLSLSLSLSVTIFGLFISLLGRWWIWSLFFFSWLLLFTTSLTSLYRTTRVR